MFPNHPIRIVIAFVTIILLIGGLLLLFLKDTEPEVQAPISAVTVEETTPEPFSSVTTIGTSVLGRSIEAYTFGTGTNHVLFVGGIHGGYEWNSVLLAYELIDHINLFPTFIPENVTVTVIPSLNPDGLVEVIGKEGRFTLLDVPKETGGSGIGRFNANNVDLNRNFACKWQPKSTWRGATVSAGTSAFSEPETQAIRDFVLTHKPKAVAFFHSQSNAVYASECEMGVLPETLTVMNLYAQASGYKPVATFDAYEITGDAEGWLASIGIPAITVELETHETVEWSRNKEGITALLKHFGKKT
jgi:predicted deacylase